MKKFLVLSIVSIITIVATAACGGGEEETTSTASPTATSGTSSPIATSTGTPRTTASPGATTTPTGSPTTGRFGRLSNLPSYRYTMKMELKGLDSSIAEGLEIFGGGQEGQTDTVVVEFNGSYVSPDKAEVHFKAAGVEDEIVIVVIGNQQWVKFGDLVVGPNAAEGPASELNFVAEIWDEEFLAEAGGVNCTGERRENVNGIATRRCQLSQATLEQLASLFGGTEERGEIRNVNFEMWLHENEGWPARVRMQASGTDETGQPFDVKFDMDITDVGRNIDIRPPTS